MFLFDNAYVKNLVMIVHFTYGCCHIVEYIFQPERSHVEWSLWLFTLFTLSVLLTLDIMNITLKDS